MKKGLVFTNLDRPIIGTKTFFLIFLKKFYYHIFILNKQSFPFLRNVQRVVHAQ